MRSGVRGTALAAVCLSSVVGLAGADADACVNETERSKASSARILDARTFHDRGRYLEAAEEIRGVSLLDFFFDDDRRAQMYEVLALSAIRSRGAVDPDLISFQSSPDPEERVKRVEKAVRHLEERLATDRAHVLELRAAVAEGYWLLGEVARAKVIFDELVEDDVVPSPQTWMAIAYLRAADGDKDGAEAAYDQCKALSGDHHGPVCSLTKDFPGRPTDHGGAPLVGRPAAS